MKLHHLIIAFLFVFASCGAQSLEQPPEVVAVRECYDQVVKACGAGDLTALVNMLHPNLRLFVEPIGSSSNVIHKDKIAFLRTSMATIARQKQTKDFQVHEIRMCANETIARVIIKREEEGKYEIWYFQQLGSEFLLRESPYLKTTLLVEQMLYTIPETERAKQEFVNRLEIDK